MPVLLNVAQIIRKPSGHIFIYDTEGNLLETPCKGKELRRPFGGEGGGAIQQTLQFSFDDSIGTTVGFETNLITRIEISAGRYRDWPALTGTGIPPEDIAAKFQEVYAYLEEFVFQCCCEDGTTPTFPYPTNTWTVWLATLNDNNLPKGLWIEVTAIPSQPSAIFSMFCTETNQIALGGFGQFLNADWQNIGDYSGVLALTTVPFTANIGQWYAGIEGSAIDGDVVIWNCLHYQVVDAASFDGNDPATNTVAYTLLPKATADMGYITEVDEIEFDFVPDWLQYRVDKRGNAYRFSQNTGFIGYTAIDLFQWGRDTNYSCEIVESKLDVLNIVGDAYLLNISGGAAMDQIICSLGSSIYSITLKEESTISNLTLNDTSLFHDVELSMSSVMQAWSLDTSAEVRFLTIGNNCEYSNKTVSGGYLDGVIVGVDQLFSETLPPTGGFTGVRTEPGFSNDVREVDITGLTTLDLSVTEKVGIFNLISSNPTESINLISNYPKIFPYTLSPAAGLVLTVTFTAFASLSANNQVVGESVSIVLDGDKGESITFDSATIATYSVSRQINAVTVQ